jgi:5'-nucleotidase/UDP-sugar diphosphatase
LFATPHRSWERGTGENTNHRTQLWVHLIEKPSPAREDVVVVSSGTHSETAVPAPITFTILHTNDMHSNLVGMAPSSDYTPDTLNDDKTIGGFARLGTVIAARRKVREAHGPVLILDAGDYSMGTAFGAAIRDTGAELMLMHSLGYDATTFGNHEFDLGPAGMASAIAVAANAGRVPAVVASNTDFSGDDGSLAGLKRLGSDGVITEHIVIERGGIRFGLFGLMGKESVFYAPGAGAISFPDAIETAKKMVTLLRDTEKADVVICLSHGGLLENPDGTFTTGDDVTLAQEVPGIDVVVGGHSHSALRQAIVCNDHTPVVQAGKYTECLGELVISMEGDELTVESYELHPIDDSILGDKRVTVEIEKVKDAVTEVVFASRGYAVDQPLVNVEQDVPNTFTDIVSGTPLSNFVTDAFRAATGADIGFSANGMMRSPFTKGNSGVQTVYDVFAVTPLGQGVADDTAGSALVTAYFTGREIKNLLEFLLVDNPVHPGEYFPRTSGMRFRYDTSRPQFDAVTAIELGDLDRGYEPIDISETADTLYSLTCPLYLGIIALTIPKYSKGALPLSPKNKDGQPLTSRVEALDLPRGGTPYLLPPRHTLDASTLAISTEDACREIKEWQAVMDHLRNLPVRDGELLPTFPLDDRAKEARAIKEG